jgi:hypothetical protein
MNRKFVMEVGFAPTPIYSVTNVNVTVILTRVLQMSLTVCVLPFLN